MIKARKTSICPTCGSKVPAAQGPVVMDPKDGLPVALSIWDGLGLPVVDPGSVSGLRVFLDGEPARNAVAFDREAGLLWRHQKDEAGHIMIRGGQILVEKVQGVVTLNPVANDEDIQ